MTEISIVIPAYNEELRLRSTLSSVYEYLDKQGFSFEIVVVDDGSQDNTAGVVEEFATTHKEVRLLSYAPNSGKGFAVRTGMLSACGDYVLMNDADGASPIEEIRLLLAAIGEGYEVAIGSRAKKDEGRKTTVKAHLHRKYMGNTFNLIVQSLLLPGLKDTQCGFKLFTRQCAQDVFSVSRLNGFAFDVEVLYICRLRNYKVKEVPINWTNITGSKVNVFTDSTRMFLDVLKITLAGWFGRYKRLERSR